MRRSPPRWKVWQLQARHAVNLEITCAGKRGHLPRHGCNISSNALLTSVGRLEGIAENGLGKGRYLRRVVNSVPVHMGLWFARESCGTPTRPRGSSAALAIGT